MNDLDAPEGDAPDSSIERYLVRHGALARRRLVGSIRPLGLGRGDRALIRTERGVEAAEVLLGPNELPQSLADRSPAGEALEKLAPPAGHLSEEALSAANAEERALAEERVRRLVERRVPETVIVDVETLWEGRDLIFYLAFEGSHELGRIAVEASTPTLRVRFESHDPPEDLAVERFDDGIATPASNEAKDLPSADRRPREERFKEMPDPFVGELPQVLATPGKKIDYENAFRLQHHGIYVQRRREAGEPSRSAPGASKQEAMLRVRLPGGRLSTAQFLALAEIAGRFGRGELRLTTRQTIQIHGLSIGSLFEVQRALEGAGLASWATCGDTVRNIVACPALPKRASWGAAVRRATLTLDRLLQPERSPYERLWFGDDRAPPERPVDDPLFGRDLLPRKFKIAVASPSDCCTDVRTHDLGFVATLAGETLAGWNVYLGGGLGYSLDRPDTGPRFADPLGWIPAERIFDVALATIAWFRHEGVRDDRRRARLKYLVADLGIDAVREALGREANLAFEPVRPNWKNDLEREELGAPDDHLYAAAQEEGRWRVGLHVLAGRLGGEAEGDFGALRAILERATSSLAVTPHQNLLLLDLPSLNEGLRIENEFERAGYASEPGDQMRRLALACPARPTCGLALAEGERLLPEVLNHVQEAFVDAGFDPRRHSGFTLSLTGCPNGCTRAYVAEVAIVGVGPGRYAIRAGGALKRMKLNVELAQVDQTQLKEALRRVVRWWAERRIGGERFGMTTDRLGTDELATRLAPLTAKASQDRESS